MGGREMQERYLRGAIANRVDVALRVEALGVDLFGAHVLAFAVRACFVDAPALDELLVTFLRIRTLLFFSLRDILVHLALRVSVLRLRVVGGNLGRCVGSPGWGRSVAVTGGMSAEQFNHFRVHAVRR